MGTKFTKGPWNVNLMIFEDEVIDFHITDEKNGSLNAICCADEKYGTKRAGEELHANAYLIAAAPDLLESLQRVVTDADAFYKKNICSGESECISVARAAIAKALGE